MFDRWSNRRSSRIAVVVLVFVVAIVLYSHNDGQQQGGNLHKIWMIQQQESHKLPFYKLANELSKKRQEKLKGTTNGTMGSLLLLPPQLRSAEEEEEDPNSNNNNNNDNQTHLIVDAVHALFQFRKKSPQHQIADSKNNQEPLLVAPIGDLHQQQQQQLAAAAKDGTPLTNLKLPWPIVIPSLPKSGAAVLHRYFVCGGIASAHTYCDNVDNDPPQKQLLGQCILDNVEKKHRAPLQGCGNYHVWSDLGWPEQCYDPSLNDAAQQALLDAYGGGTGFTWLYIRRHASKWARSIQSWNNGTWMRKWQYCNLTNTPWGKENGTILLDTAIFWEQFYEKHDRAIRQFVARANQDYDQTRKKIAFVEINLDTMTSEEIAKLLQELTGINSTACWSNKNDKITKMSDSILGPVIDA